MPRHRPAPADALEERNPAASRAESAPGSDAPSRERSDPLTLLALVLAAFAVIAASIYIVSRTTERDRGVEVPPLASKSSWE
jgi:hypothetical protein